MPRDYKHQANRRKRSKKPAPPWVWMLAGLAIGLFVAFLIYLKSSGKPAAEQPAQVAMPAPKPKAQDTRDVRKDAAKPIPPPPKPRFDFYNTLPEMEVVVPEEEITGSKKEGVRQVDKPGTYLLQAGSFRAFEQADRLKAQLALMGLETSIQSVAVNNKDTWHRVRVGPFNDLDALHDVRVRLKQNGIDAILIRVKE